MVSNSCFAGCTRADVYGRFVRRATQSDLQAAVVTHPPEPNLSDYGLYRMVPSVPGKGSVDGDVHRLTLDTFRPSQC